MNYEFSVLKTLSRLKFVLQSKYYIVLLNNFDLSNTQCTIYDFNYFPSGFSIQNLPNIKKPNMIQKLSFANIECHIFEYIKP